MEAVTPVTVSKTRARKCHGCGERLHNGRPAVRVSDNNGMAINTGPLRFWLCRTCADVVEKTLAKARAS